MERASRLFGKLTAVADRCRRSGPRRVAVGGGQESCGAHAAHAHGAHPADRRSGRSCLEKAIVRAFRADPDEPGAASGAGNRRRSGVPRHAAAARCAARRSCATGARFSTKPTRSPTPSCARCTSGPQEGAGVKITEKEVRYVAELANLELSDAEVTSSRPIWTGFWATSQAERDRYHRRRADGAGALRRRRYRHLARRPRLPPLGTVSPWRMRRNPAQDISKCRR